MRARKRGQHRQAERAADLLGRVDQAGGEARVARASAPDIASVISDGNERPAPMPSRTIDGQHVADVAAVDRRLREQRQPGGDQHQARAAASPARPKRMISRAEKPSESAPISDRDRQEREADLERVVAEHPLQVEGAEEEHPEHPGDHQRLDDVGAARRCASGRSAAASAGAAARARGRRSRRAAATATAPKPSVCAEPQP